MLGRMIKVIILACSKSLYTPKNDVIAGLHNSIRFMQWPTFGFAMNFDLHCDRGRICMSFIAPLSHLEYFLPSPHRQVRDEQHDRWTTDQFSFPLL